MYSDTGLRLSFLGFCFHYFKEERMKRSRGGVGSREKEGGKEEETGMTMQTQASTEESTTDSYYTVNIMIKISYLTLT